MTGRAGIASLGLLLLASAACSSGSSGGAGTTASTPPSVTETPSASASQTPTESASPTPSFSSTVKASRKCKTADLSVSVAGGQGAAGSTIVPIVFGNVSHHACTLFGYPGVSFTDAENQQLGLPADRRGGEEAVVTLGPGDSASASVKIPEPGNFDPADCEAATSAYLVVYPPDQTRSVRVEYAAQVCTSEAGRAVVQPVVPGTGG